MKAKARHILPQAPNAAYNADHLQCCSCWACGNPRRWFGKLTIQERRAFEAW
jgi:hypothetical protein